MATTDLTAECRLGYNESQGNGNLFPCASPAWLAFQAGQHIRGMSGPYKCRKWRGNAVIVETVGGNILMIRFSGPMLEDISVERQ